MRAFSIVSALTVLCSFSPPVAADFDAPKKKIDCSKPANKNKPACKPSHASSRDEIYHAAYWMAQHGEYQRSLDILALAGESDDPRILTAIGFSTRKLGNVAAALPFYARALQRNPDYVLAREYLGEAHLTRGDLAAAEAQLTEIERRAGAQSAAFAHLAQLIAAYKASRAG